jgi:hypothetical protein
MTPPHDTMPAPLEPPTSFDLSVIPAGHPEDGRVEIPQVRPATNAASCAAGPRELASLAVLKGGPVIVYRM